MSIFTRAVSDTELEVIWEPPQQGSENIVFYWIKVINVDEGKIYSAFKVLHIMTFN